MSSSGKGHSFEREIAKKLSLWISKGEREDIFYRSQSSGARATQRNKSGKDTEGQYGDICSSSVEGNGLMNIWSIEVKTGYGKKNKGEMQRWDILDLLDSSQKETVLQKFWNQCVRDAELSNREPVLIFRRNGRKPCIVFKLEYFNNLINFIYKKDFLSPMLDISGFNTLTIFNLDDFLSWADPKKIVNKIY